MSEAPTEWRPGQLTAWLGAAWLSLSALQLGRFLGDGGVTSLVLGLGWLLLGIYQIGYFGPRKVTADDEGLVLVHRIFQLVARVPTRLPGNAAIFQALWVGSDSAGASEPTIKRTHTRRRARC